MIPLTPHTDLFAVEVNEEATDFRIQHLPAKTSIIYKDGKITNSKSLGERIDIEILCYITPAEISFDVSGLVKRKNYRNDPVLVGIDYLDYLHNDYRHANSPSDSFRSLLKANGLEGKEKIVIIRNK